MHRDRTSLKIAEVYDELPSAIRDKLENANVFFSKNHSDYVARRKEKMYFLYTEDYIIPLKTRKIYIFNYATFLSEYFQLGIAPCSSAKEFLNRCSQYVGGVLGSQWAISTASGFFDCFPDGSLVIPFGSHVIDLELNPEEIWAKMHRKHRNIIRRAEKVGVEVAFGGQELLNDYLLLDDSTWERSNDNKKSTKYYLDMVETLKDNCRIYIAYHEGVPQAGAFFYFNRSMCYCMFAATRDDPEGGSSNLLHWTAIQHMKSLGVSKYSFVGCRINEDEDSKYNTLQRYKEKFGGELIRGYLFRVVYNKVMYRLFEVAMQLSSKDKRTRYKDAIDQEIHKWGNLQAGRASSQVQESDSREIPTS